MLNSKFSGFLLIKISICLIKMKAGFPIVAEIDDNSSNIFNRNFTLEDIDRKLQESNNTNEILDIKMDLINMRLIEILKKLEWNNSSLPKSYVENRKQSKITIELNDHHNTMPDKLPKSCAEALSGGDKNDGFYKIYLPESGLKSFYVYCISSSDNGAAWTLILNRVESDVNFFVDWNTYKVGFGSLDGAFFIGLDKLYALTQSALNELRIELTNFQDEASYANYDAFAIGDESTQYTLSMLGTYSGSAGDSLSYHKGQKFSTKDVDNDKSSDNCADNFKGGWWYNDCYESNLNGEYGEDKEYHGIVWWNWTNDTLKNALMAIRPINK